VRPLGCGQGAGNSDSVNATTSIDVVIVNWNAGPMLSACLRSITRALDPRFRITRVVVVDNASEDSSLELPDYDELPLSILRNERNLGFAAACNQGAKDSPADYILFLNPDTELLDDSLTKPLIVMEQQAFAEIGILGITLIGDTGQVQRHCARFPTAWLMAGRSLGLDRLIPALVPPHFMTEWDHLETRRVDQVMGAFMLVRRSLFQRLGGFDEGFFLYYEDLDFSLRAKQAGAASLYFAEATCRHHGRGTTRADPGRSLALNLRSRLRYSVKHFGLLGRLAVFATTLAAEPLVRALQALARGSRRELRTISRAYSLLIQDLISAALPPGKERAA
jgi:N-acetylglucosaminyl-diphospho-decaprenol L-rhamnosyltransferase